MRIVNLTAVPTFDGGTDRYHALAAYHADGEDLDKYRKTILFADDGISKSATTAARFQNSINLIKNGFAPVLDMEAGANTMYSPNQEVAWLTWLREVCDPVVATYGKHNIPVDVRWYITTVERHLPGRAVTDFGDDSNALGVWTPPFYGTDFEEFPICFDRTLMSDDYANFYTLIEAPSLFMVPMKRVVGGGWKGYYKLSETYEKWVYFAHTQDREDAVEFCGDLWKANRKFQQISALDATHNFTTEQKREWQRWLLKYCDPMVEEWGLENIPATLRVWMNAVELELPDRALTIFGEDRGGSGALGPMFDMSSFGD